MKYAGLETFSDLENNEDHSEEILEIPSVHKQALCEREALAQKIEKAGNRHPASLNALNYDKMIVNVYEGE